MSDEAARIITTIATKKLGRQSQNLIQLATIKSLSPLSIEIDNIGFPITAGLLKSNTIAHTELLKGDRVIVSNMDNTIYVLLDKVVTA